jgi:hypothetical protein
MSRFTTGKGLDFTLSIDTNYQEPGLPFVFLYGRDKLPYSICLGVYDDEKTYSKLLLDEVVVEYLEGGKVHIVSPKDQWEKSFEKYVYYNSSSAGVIQHEKLRINHCFTGVIDKPKDFRLKMKGHFLLKDGSQIEANSNCLFKVSRNFDIMTGWTWMSRLG